MREAVFLRRLKIGDHFGRDRFAAARPDGQDARLAGQFLPFEGDVVGENRVVARDRHVFRIALAAGFAAGRFSGELIHLHGDAQRRIADHQGGVGGFQHFRGVRRGVNKFGLDAPFLGGKDAHQRGGTARAGIERNTLGHFDRLLRKHQDAADGLLRGDGHSRQNHQILDALIFDGRDDGDVGFAARRSASAHCDGSVNDKS